MTRKTRLVGSVLLAGLLLALALVWLRPARAESRPSQGSMLRGTLHVRVWEPGGVTPNVSVNVPVFAVTAVLKVASATGFLDRALCAACHEAGSGPCLRLKGADVVDLWRRIAAGAPLQLVKVDDGAGGRVEIGID